jgi:flagellar basal body-associated protein FliL
MNAKKIFIIILVLFLLTSGALVVYNFFLKSTSAPAQREATFPEKVLNLKINAISQQ